MREDMIQTKGGIWYNPNEPGDKERAENQLREIKEGYSSRGVGYAQYLRYAGMTEIRFANGDVWKALPVGRSSCGCRFHISYISNNIDDPIDIASIRNSTTNLPYTGCNYF